MKINNFEYTNGNRKIGKDTIIVNMGTATNCPAASMCKFSNKSTDKKCKNKCYALKAERIYPQVLPFRKRQEKYWLNNTAEQIAEDIKITAYVHGTTIIKYVRINEAGDFHTIDCVKKLIKIAELNKKIKFYTYTHRKDLIDQITIKDLPKNLTINLSFKSDKENFNTFTTIEDINPNKKILKCASDCRNCKLCTTKGRKGRQIVVKAH